jgi:hypothetical protein
MTMTQTNVVLCGMCECAYGTTDVGDWKDMRDALPVDSCSIVVLLRFSPGYSG